MIDYIIIIIIIITIIIIIMKTILTNKLNQIEGNII